MTPNQITCTIMGILKSKPIRKSKSMRFLTNWRGKSNCNTRLKSWRKRKNSGRKRKGTPNQLLPFPLTSKLKASTLPHLLYTNPNPTWAERLRITITLTKSQLKPTPQRVLAAPITIKSTNTISAKSRKYSMELTHLRENTRFKNTNKLKSTIRQEGNNTIGKKYLYSLHRVSSKTKKKTPL